MHDASTATVDDIEVIDLPRVNNRAGNITAINNSVEVPFDVQRIFYLYDIPSGEARGGHAHAELEELIVAASGSFSVRLNDGKNKRTISINRPDKAIHLKPGVWIELLDFSSNL